MQAISVGRKMNKDYTMNFQDELIKMGQKAKAAGRQLAVTDTDTKNACLEAIAQAIINNKEAILKANELDLIAGEENNLTSALLDRLKLTDSRMNLMNALRKCGNSREKVFFVKVFLNLSFLID